jgi:hypothetical protein
MVPTFFPLTTEVIALFVRPLVITVATPCCSAFTQAATGNAETNLIGI